MCSDRPLGGAVTSLHNSVCVRVFSSFSPCPDTLASVQECRSWNQGHTDTTGMTEWVSGCDGDGGRASRCSRIKGTTCLWKGDKKISFKTGPSRTQKHRNNGWRSILSGFFTTPVCLLSSEIPSCWNYRYLWDSTQQSNAPFNSEWINVPVSFAFYVFLCACSCLFTCRCLFVQRAISDAGVLNDSCFVLSHQSLLKSCISSPSYLLVHVRLPATKSVFCFCYRTI